MVRHSPRSGLSIVEVAISTVLLASLTGAIIMATLRASATYGQSAATGDLNARSSRAIHRVSKELVGARWSSVTPRPLLPFDTDNLEFECPLDTAAGAVTWAPRRQIALQLQTGELDNGLDDNGNGLIDELSIVLVESPGLPGERRTVIVNGVSELLEGELPNAVDDNGNGLADEAGLSFVRVQNRLVVRLSLEELDADGNHLIRTVETSVRLRN